MVFLRMKYQNEINHNTGGQKLQKLFNDVDKKGNLRTPLEHLIVTNKISCF